MNVDFATLAERNSRIPSALLWLRNLAGIQSLREADRRYRSVLSGAPMQLGSQLSKWERGVTSPRVDRLLSYLAVIGFDFSDFESGLTVASLCDAENPARSLRDALDTDRDLANRLVETARKIHADDSDAELLDKVVEALRNGR